MLDNEIHGLPPTPMAEKQLATPEQKREVIKYHFREIMQALGLDLEDDSLCDTPTRVAKMYVDEICKGLDPRNFPKITCVENKFGSQMVTVGKVTMNSLCEHHFVTIAGYAHVSYIPRQKVIGLSKINRLVDYFGSRPQVQERLTEQVQKTLAHLLETPDVAVIIDGVHFCVRARGIKDGASVTRTTALGGVYLQDMAVRKEFLDSIPTLGEFKL